ncbi:MAG: hypothetical protein IJW43_02750 [Clostridia bacterium]|nr:hypothetical protein [Clostridia bacterium]
MNEKLQYASMLEMPNSSSTITYKPIKKKRTKKVKVAEPDSVKQELVDKVNAQVEEQALEEGQGETLPIIREESSLEQTPSVSIREKKKFKFSLVTLQSLIIVALIAVIAVTNLVNENSGINVFVRGLFQSEKVVVDQREFSEFSPVFNLNGTEFVVEEGVASVSYTGSVYAPCDAVVESVTQDENGLYSIVLSHSQNFASKIDGLKFVYSNVGEQVYSNIPVGYAEVGFSTCFFDSSRALITGYEIIDNAVVWAV